MPEQKKKIVQNFISLSMVQGLSVIFPLITFPYLLRVLGVEGFGVFTMVQTIIMYFDLLVSFGFGLTATQQIARNLNNAGTTRQIISAVYIIKGLLFAVSVSIFLIGCLFVPYLRENIFYILISSLYLLGNLLFPDWYFQGIQKMKNITLVAFISKAMGLLLIIFLVHKPSDIGYAILALSAGNFIAGCIGFIILKRTTSVGIMVPRKQFIAYMFRESAYVFTSIILAPLYISVNIFILRFFTNPLVVGYYAIAEKIFQAVGMFTSIANRTFYPHLSQLYAQSVPRFTQQVRRIAWMFFGAFGMLAVAQYFFAGFLVKVVSGNNDASDMSQAVLFLKILSIALLFSPYVSFFFQLLIIQGQKKSAIRNCAIAVCINFITACILTYLYGGTGMAINVCITTCVIACLNIGAYYKKHKLLPAYR